MDFSGSILTNQNARTEPQLLYRPIRIVSSIPTLETAMMTSPASKQQSNNNNKNNAKMVATIVVKPMSATMQKRYKTKPMILTLAIIQLFCSLYMGLTGLSCAIITFYRKEPWFYTPVCLNGSGLYVGILCFACSLVGILYWYMFKSDGLAITYLIAVLASAIACAVELILASVWTYKMATDKHLNPNTYYGDQDPMGLVKTNLTLNSLVAIIAFINCIVCFITFGFMCYNTGCCCEVATDRDFSTLDRQRRHFYRHGQGGKTGGSGTGSNDQRTAANSSQPQARPVPVLQIAQPFPGTVIQSPVSLQGQHTFSQPVTAAPARMILVPGTGSTPQFQGYNLPQLQGQVIRPSAIQKPVVLVSGTTKNLMNYNSQIQGPVFVSVPR